MDNGLELNSTRQMRVSEAFYQYNMYPEQSHILEGLICCISSLDHHHWPRLKLKDLSNAVWRGGCACPCPTAEGRASSCRGGRG